MRVSPWVRPGAWSWVRLVVVLDSLVVAWVPPGTGGWARHLHGLGGLTCMFVISLTFGDVWGWLVSSFFMPSDLVLCGFGGLLTL